MSTIFVFLAALLLQLAAQAFGGVWGAAAGGLLIGVALRRAGAFRFGFSAAAAAAALLLGWVALRGGNVMAFAAMLGGNFKLPEWGVLVATFALPALQAGGLAGGTSRLLRNDRANA
ncbi:MAG: hypothetical protein ACK55A_11230 [Gemmatimonas sp.]